MTQTTLTVDDWLREMQDAATRLAVLGALEGAAGNISLFLPHETPGLDGLLRDRFPPARAYTLPAALPAGTLLITGTGRRLPELASRPDAVLCAIHVSDGAAHLHRHREHGVEPTSEIDSHVGIHAALLNDARPHAVIHAQPPKLTWLSHVPAYRDEARLNRQILRWQPETLVMLPDGIGLLPYEVPGTPAQGHGTVSALRSRRLVVWAKHGVVARSERGPLAAADLIDYAEAAAGYELTDLLAGRVADGLSLDELRGIATRFGVHATLLGSLPEDVLR